MPITTTHQIWTPNDTDAWDIIVDLAAMAVSVDTALSRVSNFRRGTTSEMQAAFASAPAESLWFNTSTMTTFIRGASRWVEASPNALRGPKSEMDNYPNPKVGMTWWDTSNNISWNRTSSGWVVADTGWYQVGEANQPFAVTYRPGIGPYAVPPWSGMRWRVKDGVFYMGGAVSKTTNIANGDPVVDIAAALRPPGSIGGTGFQYYATVNAVVSNSNLGQAISGYVAWPI